MKLKFFRTSAKILVATIFLAGCQTTYIPENDFDVTPEFFIKNEWNKTLLEAVRNNDYNLAKECLEKKASTGVYDLLGQTALMYACWNGNFQMVKLLCEWQNKVLWFKKSPEAKINRLSLYNYNALFCAAYKGDVEIMNYLMGKGAEFYGREDSNGENILHKLAKSNSPQAIQNFIEQNSKSQKGKNLLLQMSLKKDKNGCTPFFHSVAKGNVEAASLLLSIDETKTVLNEGSNNGYFPLYMAFENRNQNMFFFLLEQPELDAHCSTPIKNGNSYQKINLSTFYEVRTDSYINSKQFPTNLFRDAYANRITWENNGRIGKLIIVDEKIKKQRSEFYKMVCDKNTTLEELKKKRLELGSLISGSDVSENNKNILLQALDTPRTIKSKIELFDFLFSECKISCSGLDMYDSDQILRYAIETAGSSFNRKISDDIEIIKFLIKNNAKYENAYKLTMPRTDYDIWKLILRTSKVRNSLEWDELAELLSILDKKADFSKTNRADLFLYSISGGSNANYEELKYKKELFDLFINELNDGKLYVNNIPITTWLYQEKFFYGVEKILCNKKIADSQYIRSARQGTSLDTFKDILEKDLTSSDEEIKSHAKKFLDMYNALYPEEVKAKNGRARAKAMTKQTMDSDSL